MRSAHKQCCHEPKACTSPATALYFPSKTNNHKQHNTKRGRGTEQSVASRHARHATSFHVFFGRSILARKWLAKMTKTRQQNENENFQPGRIVAIRDWNGRDACEPTHSSELQRASWLVAHFRCGLWGWLENVHSRRGSRACVARIDRRVTGEQQVCLRTTR